MQGQAGLGGFLMGPIPGSFTLLCVRAFGLDLLLAAAVSFTLRVSGSRCINVALSLRLSCSLLTA